MMFISYIHRCMLTDLNACTHTDAFWARRGHIWRQLRSYTYIHTCVHTYIQMLFGQGGAMFGDSGGAIHTCIHTFVHTYMRAYIHIDAFWARRGHIWRQWRSYTYIHTCVHTYVQMLFGQGGGIFGDNGGAKVESERDRRHRERKDEQLRARGHATGVCMYVCVYVCVCWV